MINSTKYWLSLVLSCFVTIVCLGQNSQISGHIFHDENNNCVKDSTETGLPGRIVALSPGPLYAMTDSDGFYSFAVETAGVYTVSVEQSSDLYDYWEFSCVGDDLFVAVSPNQTVTDQNFAFIPTETCPVLDVKVSMAPIIPCTENKLIIDYRNRGTAVAEFAYVEFFLDENIMLVQPSAESFDQTEDDEDSVGINAPGPTPSPTDTVDITISEPADPQIDGAPNFTNNTIYLGNVPVGGSGRLTVDLEIACNAIPNSSSCVQANIYPQTYCGAVDPLWDGSELKVSATCLGDSIEFFVQNIGDDMDHVGSITVYEDDLMIQPVDIDLVTGEVIRLKFPANGKTYTVQAPQSPYYPGYSNPLASVEACSPDGNNISYGHVTAFSQDDRDPFKDVFCSQVAPDSTGLENTKTVEPTGITDNHYIHSDEILEFTIRFTNPYEVTDSSLIILDELSPFLDINTLQINGSSHYFNFELMPDKTLRWDINNVAPNSYGYVSFSVQVLPGVPAFTQIDNDAVLYFGGNPSIVTNNTVVIVCDECTAPLTDRSFQAKVFLEGPYQDNGTMHTLLNPMIPIEQPFNEAPYDYIGAEVLSSVPAEMVDWVLVEARYGTLAVSGNRTSITIERQPALLFSDGSVRSLDGSLGVTFKNLVDGNLYNFCIRHRNHLDVLTGYSIPPSTIMEFDFTTDVNKAFGNSQLKVGLDGKAMLYSSDLNADGIIQATDYDAWSFLPAAVNVYKKADANLDGLIQTTDYDQWFNNKAKVGILEIKH